MSVSPYLESRQRFERDTADHEMAVVRDEDLYRHLRFNAPGTWCMGFDIVTWPGYLVICGDVETYVFAREADMFDWFLGSREARTEINPSYWSEKLQGDRRGRDISRRYSHDAFRVQMLEWARGECELADFDGEPMYEGLLVEALEREVLAEHTIHEGEARDRIRELEDDGVITGETWEWELRDFNPWFLWCCHAILWGIRQYRAATLAVSA